MSLAAASPPLTAPPYRLETIASVEGLRAFRPAWEALQEDPKADLDVFLAMLDDKAGAATPHVAVVYAGDTPAVMLVATVETIRVSVSLSHITLARPRMRALLAPFGVLHGNTDDTAAELLAEHLVALTRSGAVDVVRLWDLPMDSPLHRALARRVPGHLRDCAHGQAPHLAVSLPGDFDAYLTRLRGNHRRAYRRRCQALEGPNPEGLSYLLATRPEDVDRFCNDAEAVSRKTFQRGLGASFVDSPGERRRLRLMAEKGLWRGYVLYVDDAPCAFWYGALCRDRFHAIYTGYDAAYSHLNPGPGSTLLVKMIEDLCRHTPATELGFGFGEDTYKQRFADRRSGPHVWLTQVYAPRLKPVCVHATQRALHFALHTAKVTVDTLGLRGDLRRWWRRHISGTGQPGR